MSFVERRLAQAQRAVEAGRLILREGFAEVAVNRASYAMFYAAEALLRHDGVRRVTKHSAVRAAFGERFAKPRRIDPGLHRWLIDAFEDRMLADYAETHVVTYAVSPEEHVERAEAFVRACRAYAAEHPARPYEA